MKARGAGFANGLKNLLDKVELIGGEGVAGGKIVNVCVGVE